MASFRPRGIGSRTSICRWSESAACRIGDAHLCVGQALLTLRPGHWVGLAASLRKRFRRSGCGAANGFDREGALLDRARPHLADSPPDWIEQLALAADSFLFARLPGLARWRTGDRRLSLVRRLGPRHRDRLAGFDAGDGPIDSARRILLTFARFVDQGMLPNVFPGAGETPDYNTVDAGCGTSRRGELIWKPAMIGRRWLRCSRCWPT